MYAETFGQIGSFFDLTGSTEGEFATGKAVGLVGDGNGDVSHGFLSGTGKK
jgi:hypothetical protein